MSQADTEIQAEIRALETVLSALAPLDEDIRRRVLRYVQERFGYGSPMASQSSEASKTPIPEVRPSTPASLPEVFSDIRTLKEKKRPANATEMAVLVAHYLSDIAPESERRETIGTGEISKYFQQADYRATGQPRVILHRAKNAGYLDSATRGQYQLNPVGRNLARQGLPRSESDARVTSRRATTSKRSGGKRKSQTPKKPASRRRKSSTGRKSATRSR